MTQAAVSDTPFPGAHSQVPHMHADAEEPARMPRTLPLESTPVLRQLGWSIRLPVRAEDVVVEKQVVVRERWLSGVANLAIWCTWRHVSAEKN